MLRYLVDSTAVWRLQRDPALSAARAAEVHAGTIGSCHPQRTEFRRSARNLDEYDQMTDMFGDLYPDAPVPKNAWRWIETAQYRLARRGRHQSLSVADWLICATAVHHGLIVLHDDKDFAAAADVLPDLSEHHVHHVPKSPPSSTP
ncbi:PIN domain-containing protein [Streptomyces sp. NPDC053431]|uniref:PIN domain-containing protein n=1 Tax=Streptomyces sp. NPDC053431 TaxID=3365703 RepID=UPI0037D83925